MVKRLGQVVFLLVVPVFAAWGTAVPVCAPASLGAASGGLLLCDMLGDSVTISNAGLATLACKPGACSSSMGPITSSGNVIWGGKIGPFTINMVIGQTTPALPIAETNVSLMVSTGATGGTLLVQWTDTGFSGAHGTATMKAANTINGTVHATYTGHIDSNNAAFGTEVGTTVGQLGPFTMTGSGSLTGPGPTSSVFSMTSVLNAVMAPASALAVSGYSLNVPPVPVP
jgi:hypothetical protein